MTLALIPSAYESLFRPLLFKLPPERAQHLADRMLQAWPLWRAVMRVNAAAPEVQTSAGGLDMSNPIGLAAGYDKVCQLTPGLSSLGFGYVTCGTVTLDARPGNPGVRLLRDPQNLALTNALGFPGDGLEAAAENLTKDRRHVEGTPIVASISGTEIDDIVTCHRRLEPLVDAIEVNISSPNTAGLRLFHSTYVLAELLAAISERRSQPLFVKMPPFPERHQDDDQHDLVLSLAQVCVSEGVEALTVANTQLVSDARLGVGSGGLSGKPIYGQMTRMVSEVRSVVGNSTAINACGGIFTAADAWGALCAGADTIQLLTGMVYRGPGIARDIARGLARLVSLNGLTSVRDLRSEAGSDLGAGA